MSLRLTSLRLNLKTATRAFSAKFPDHKFVLTDDESTYVAWHPATEFPYECTRPIPDEKVDEGTSVLKTQMTPQLYEVLKKKPQEYAIQELMNITHTCKHRWYPRSRDKKKKQLTLDREYL